MRRYTAAWPFFAFCVVFYLLVPFDRAAGQGTPEPAPEVAQGPATGADQVPAPAANPPAPIPQYTLTIGKTGNGQGRLTSNPGGTLFKRGTLVTLRAVPEINSLFSGWSGSCSGLSINCSTVMTADKAVTASFSLKGYTIRVSPPVNGVIHPSGSVKATHGDKRRFEVIPLPGYRVAEVLVDKTSVGAVNSYTFKDVRADHVMEATFVKQ